MKLSILDLFLILCTNIKGNEEVIEEIQETTEKDAIYNLILYYIPKFLETEKKIKELENLL